MRASPPVNSAFEWFESGGRGPRAPEARHRFHLVEDVDDLVKLALVPPVLAWPGAGPAAREPKALPARSRSRAIGI